MGTEGKGLEEILNENFAWNKARVACFAGMLRALIKVRTVNLVELACAFSSSAKMASRYKRIKRFFSEFTIDAAEVAGWMAALLGLDKEAIYLSMDRTNWCWGKSDINVLMLSIVYKGIAVPVFWSMLDTCGNSATADRIVLVQTFVNRFGKDKIAGILADREFAGSQWFGWLRQENIPFGIRIKKNTLTANSRGEEVQVGVLFQDLQAGQPRILAEPRKLLGQMVYLSALRLSDGELLIVATDQLLTDPIALYAKRWEIETLFGCLKSKGFNFEETHMVNPARINKLLTLLSIAFCWAHKAGEWRHEEEKKIPVKKHGRKSQSWFRHGLDYLRDILINTLSPHRHQFHVLLALLSASGERRSA